MFSEKATKFEKIFVVVFCVCNSVLVKKSTKIFQNKCGKVVLYKLYRTESEIWADLGRFTMDDLFYETLQKKDIVACL